MRRSLLMLAFAGGCGFQVQGGAATSECGDGLVDPGEECDDGDRSADVLCDAMCRFTCGNGNLEVSVGERCDSGIASGLGACPTSCDDGDACTSDALTGAQCSTQCAHDPINAPVTGDGCCPPGATEDDDADCATVCGNGTVDAGETCDVAIGGNAPGRCPVTCNDMQACTIDALLNPGTCTAACTTTTITSPMDNDGCCPPSANSTNDNDCPASCGNMIVEGSEDCDDGNMNNSDTCRNNCTYQPTPFRFGDLDLRDPHILVPDPSLVSNMCRDVTDQLALGYSYNSSIQLRLTTDLQPFDGDYDLSPTLVFRPLAQANGASAALELHFATCSGANPISCDLGATAPASMIATSKAMGTCLDVVNGSVRPYSPAVTPADGTCFVTAPTSLTLPLAGITWTLIDAQIAAVYTGTAATNLVEGVVRGFLTETAANATGIANGVPVIGGHRLSYLLPGGDPMGPDANCAAYSDKDTHNGATGWWVYFNFTAPRATWLGP